MAEALSTQKVENERWISRESILIALRGLLPKKTPRNLVDEVLRTATVRKKRRGTREHRYYNKAEVIAAVIERAQSQNSLPDTSVEFNDLTKKEKIRYLIHKGYISRADAARVLGNKIFNELFNSLTPFSKTEVIDLGGTHGTYYLSSRFQLRLWKARREELEKQRKTIVTKKIIHAFTARITELEKLLGLSGEGE